MKNIFVVLFAVIVTACSQAALAPVANAPQSSAESFSSAQAAAQKVYWTLFASPSLPQVQIANVPLKTTSSVTNIDNNSSNGLTYTSGVTFYKGQLWVLSFGSTHGAPGYAVVFKLPLTSSSKPLYTFKLSGTSGEDALAFDPSGNLWVDCTGSHSILEYKGPFTKTGTLKPALSIPTPHSTSYAIAFDKAAKLYASFHNSRGSDSIGVLAPPYNGNPYFFNGLKSPGGLIFDNEGNLYSSTNGASGAALVRYDSNNLQSGATPNAVDPAGLPSGSYLSSFAFAANGDLYVANCGKASSAGIDVYPLGSQKLTSKLEPSVEYANSDITSAACAWGIAIH